MNYVKRYRLADIKDVKKFVLGMESKGYKFGNADRYGAFIYKGEAVAAVITYRLPTRKYYQLCALLNI